MGPYAQDDFRALSRLTLNLGLRYELQTTPNDLSGTKSIIPDIDDPSQTYTFGPPMSSPGLTNFSPRIGFAWDVFGTGKAFVRAASGSVTTSAIGSALEQQPKRMSPDPLHFQVTSNPNNLVLPILFTYTGVARLVLLDCRRWTTTPKYLFLPIQLTVEQQLPKGIGPAVSYVGLQGRNLWPPAKPTPKSPRSSVDSTPGIHHLQRCPIWALTKCPPQRRNAELLIRPRKSIRVVSACHWHDVSIL